MITYRFGISVNSTTGIDSLVLPEGQIVGVYCAASLQPGASGSGVQIYLTRKDLIPIQQPSAADRNAVIAAFKAYIPAAGPPVNINSFVPTNEHAEGTIYLHMVQTGDAACVIELDVFVHPF